MPSIELLAPARDPETGMAAVNCGADAVYIGAERFGAREDAGNSMSGIETLIRHAHKYWAKVYVALNTILRDDELPEALRIATSAHEAGADGLIIQDMGLLECGLPPLPLIASTQMHNHTPERVLFLERAGFRRVILARELSLDRIASIRGRTTIELEAFIHGSLCASYSGRCLMSYAIGGRSGNRGACAQPCRRAYSVFDSSGAALAKAKYVLSLKDMNRSEWIRGMIGAGITSFKIEGRLKDITVIMNTVAWYRQALDRVLESDGLRRSASGRPVFDFTPDLNKTFNRGYTEYLLKGRNDARVRRDSFTVETDTVMRPGDGLCFFDGKMVLTGTRIDRVEGKTVFPRSMEGICEGTVIYRNEDNAFSRSLRKSRTERKIGVSFVFSETPEGFRLEARDEDGTRAGAELKFEKQSARDGAGALETVKKQLAKTGGTEFECLDVDVRFSEARFIPVSELNAARRTVLENLSKVRENNRPRSEAAVVPNDFPCPEKTLTCRDNVLNKKAEAFYRRHGAEHVEFAAESGLDMRGRTLMTTRLCVLNELGLCLKKAGKSGPRPPFFLVDEDGRRFELRFRCDVCEMDVVHLK
jgi:collagenase-like PrtC family protease